MILVAGGTGHLGTELTPLLIGRGLRVRVLTRDPLKVRQVVGADFELAGGDVRDLHSVEAAMSGVDTVVSAISGFGPGGAGPREIDYRGNLNLITAAEAAGVAHFILLSMHGAAARHPMELLRMKHSAEEALRASRLEWTIIRPTVFMELWAGIIGRPIRKTGKATVFGTGDNPVNFVSVSDLARFVKLAVVDRGLRRQVLDIGGPENLTLNQVVQLFDGLLGKKTAVSHIPRPVMRLSSLVMRPFKPDLARMIQAGVVMDTADMTFDAGQVRRDHPNLALRTFDEALRARV